MGDQILEIGCGPGVAVALVCDRLTTGTLTAIDRSATAITRTSARNSEHVAAGRAKLAHVDMAGLDLHPRSFDKAFAIDVNVFWTTTADAECDVLRRVLRPRGQLLLIYGKSPSGQTRDVTPTITANLQRHGFRTDVVTHPGGRMVGIRGRLATMEGKGR